MTRSLAFAGALLGAFTIAAPASAQPATKTEAPATKTVAAAPAEPPALPKPGPEQKALAPVVGNYTWTDGKMMPGAAGPGSPEMPTHGKQKCKPTLGGLWFECEMTDTAGTGKTAMTWMGHMLIGWDYNDKTYKMVGADNMGAAYEVNGRQEGAKFVFESPRDVMMMGIPTKFRFTFDATDPKAVKFTDERAVRGGPYKLAESATFKKAP